MDIYLHGIETQERNDGPRPVATIDTGVIGAIVTAPDALASLFPKDKAIIINGFDGLPAGLGQTGTAMNVLEAIFSQATRASQTVVLAIIEEGDTAAETMQNALGSAADYTGMHALRRAFNELGVTPKILIAPGLTSLRPSDGMTAINISANGGGTGYTSVPTVALSGGGGAGATAEAVINSETGKVTAVVITNPGVGYTSAPTVTFSGGGASVQATATAAIGVVANPVAKGLVSIANRMRACVILDGPNTTSVEAIAYRRDFDSDRVLILDPYVKAFDDGEVVQRPGSAYVAGLQAKVDYEEGFWQSPSNREIEGIVGIARPIDHARGDPSSESQYLNRNNVATFIRGAQGGFKLWGSRVASGDALKQFWSVRRSHDTIITSIEIASEPFVDRAFSIQSISDISETAAAALRRWTALGATLGGRVWLDRKLNTKETWASGHIFINYDAEGPAPMEHITFVFNRNTGYYETLAEDAVAEIARISNRSAA